MFLSKSGPREKGERSEPFLIVPSLKLESSIPPNAHSIEGELGMEWGQASILHASSFGGGTSFSEAADPLCVLQNRTWSHVLMCVFSQQLTIPQHQLGVQLCSALMLPADSSRSHRPRAQSYKTILPPQLQKPTAGPGCHLWFWGYPATRGSITPHWV